MSDSAQKSTTTQQRLRGKKGIPKKIDKTEKEENTDENSHDEEEVREEETSIATRIKSLRRSTIRTKHLNCYVYNDKNENNDDLVDQNTNIKQEQQEKQNKKRTKVAQKGKKLRNKKQISSNSSDTSINDDRKGSKLSNKRNNRLDNSMSTGENKIYLENKKFAESIIDKEGDEITMKSQNTTNEYDFDEDDDDGEGDDDDEDDECNNDKTNNENFKVKNLRKSLEEQMISEEQQTTTTSKSGAGSGSVTKTNKNNKNNNENNNENKDGCFINPQLAAFNFGNLFYCNFCGYSANNTNKILHHLFVHVFKCNLCSHFTYTKYDLMKHIYKCHRPNKELKIKRLVLEVTSNDWYFLCSENDAHCISNTLSDNDDVNNIKVNSGGGGTPVKSSQSQSKCASSTATPQVKTNKKSGVGGDSKSKTMTSILKSCIETNHDTSTNTSNENSINLQDSGQKKKPVMNYFVTKVEKKQEKITPVIQSNKISSSSTTTTTTTTNETTTSVDQSNKQSIDVVDSRTNKITSQSQQQQQKSSKLTEILTSCSDLLKLNSNDSKVAKAKKTTQASVNEADATPAPAPAPAAAATAVTPSRSTRSKRVPPPKKYTPECTEFSTETKKDLESIKNKYTNMECRYTCKQCKYEATSAVMAYTHLVISNHEHSLKCFVCDVYNSDNVCSYKMHLLSKHKVYASADKLFHEYFTIIDTLTNEKVSIESPLTSIKLSSTTTTATNANHPSSTPISTKTSGVKRNIVESDNNAASETSNDTQQVVVTNSKRKKLFDNNLNEKEKEAKNTQQSTLDSMAYETETLDDGSTIYICSKCKLVFLKTQLLIEHKCYTSSTNKSSSNNSQKKGTNSQDKTQKSNNSASNNTSNNSKYNNINEFFSITRSILNKTDVTDKQHNNNLSSNDDCDDEEMIQISDYDNIKNNSDVIYIDE